MEICQEADTFLADNSYDLSSLAPDIILPMVAALTRAEHHGIQNKLIDVINKITTMSSAFSSICISSEFLSETSGSLKCLSVTPEKGFGLLELCHLARASCGIAPHILLCLRDPIPHLASKYMRCSAQRKAKKLRHLSPTEYIAKQVYLDQNQPNTSAIAPVVHSRFLRDLQRVAYVKAFGFKELLDSEDVFSLMGFLGEEALPFRSLPRENKAPLPREEMQLIEKQISDSLQANGYYDVIMEAKMYE